MKPSKGIRPVFLPTNMVKYWLMKSELDVYPYAQLVTDGKTHWDGVRNYQARNMMRDEMKVGDYPTLRRVFDRILDADWVLI